MATRSRRRRKNPLLTRILVISVLAHVIILPIAAHFGAFEKIRKQFGDSTIVMFTTPPIEAVEKPKAKPEEKAKKADAGKKAHTGAKSASKSASNLPQPKVVTGDAAAGGEGGPTAESGTGKAGVLPTGPASTAKKPEDTKAAPPAPPEPEKTKPDEPKPEPAKSAEPIKAPTPTPKPRRIVEATELAAPEPTIPDDLRTEPLDKTLYVEADVDANGQPQNVKVSQSTGIRELDDIGLETARKYRFHPATVDDAPVAQHVQFQIHFQVS